VLLSNGLESAEDLFCRAKGFLERSDGLGVLQVLSLAKAYSDPVRKKSLFFCALTVNQGLWKFSDLENLGPPVDYHEIRGHLRLGTVEICDPDLLQALTRGTVDEEADIEIRRAVYNAIIAIGRDSGRTPRALHYFFWNLFRSCCKRESPHCRSCGPDCALPDRYRMLRNGELLCQLSEVCASRNASTRIVDYSVPTHYY